ncbi:MAG TPA: gliding motility lipoprotein GldH [Bacteroidales bacterium]|nr:gliding motility lipoprotein GldH [Bacteroidales bacterium]
MKILQAFLFTALVFGMVSCDPNMVYDHFEKTNDGQWSWDDVKTFKVDMTDTITAYNIYIDIRHTRAYPKSNLYVFLNILSPAGAEVRDTVGIDIADERGRWMGSGFGNVKLIRRLYRRDVRFAVPGTYTFTLEQAMRLKEVPVTDVGIRIEKYKKLK